ncbi:PLP-dependent aminotransferase family protein [Kocuria sp.]|uniref:aminotransferase-like domain-containing protein n=1 Tax=Kocuria sp. TaxID=1871328 RepID=UPI0026DB2E93|nr:PLP-dependent aminotransferase family protein [Kocuria sp.]MDO4918933.1 PLP-dependent aminotransferase family protein [Kocuria sp.]
MSAFASRAGEFRPSPVRAVFETAMDPAVVSLAGGNPDLSVLPGGSVGELAGQLIRERAGEILQYGSGAGTRELRELIVRLMARGGSSVTEADVLPTTGSQAGLDLVTKLYCNPGDVILAEGPTYVGALGVFGAYEVGVHHVDVDEQGLDPEAVAAALDELAARGTRVPFVYAIPSFQNPTGVTMPVERRRELVRVCAERDVMIIEDDPYAFLAFDRSDPLPSMHGMDPEHVIHLGSFSKVFAPGLRVGWIAAPPEVRGRLQIAAESVVIHPSNLAQTLVTAWVGSEQWAPALDQAVELYRQRWEAMDEALTEFMPDTASWTTPTGGFFTWVTAEELRGRDILTEAIAHGVVLVPGSASYMDGRESDAVRLAFSGVAPARIREGVKRFGEALRGL